MAVKTWFNLKEKEDLMKGENKTIIETIGELEKNTSLIKKIGDIAAKGNSEDGDAGKANAEIIELLHNAGITPDNDSSSDT